MRLSVSSHVSPNVPAREVSSSAAERPSPTPSGAGRPGEIPGAPQRVLDTSIGITIAMGAAIAGICIYRAAAACLERRAAPPLTFVPPIPTLALVDPMAGNVAAMTQTVAGVVVQRPAIGGVGAANCQHDALESFEPDEMVDFTASPRAGSTSPAVRATTP